jgi:phosphoribosylformylglycinamidine synthase subunit PurQ / glutaminase
MAAVRALVLTGYGINCEVEMAHGFKMAGAVPTIAHVRDLLDGLVDLHSFHILAFPGGFSFGDHLGSGRVLANELRQGPIWAELEKFIADGKYIWGVCNGFQAMVKLGLLPGLMGFGTQEVTLMHNDSGRFEDRWAHLAVNDKSPCVYTKGLTRLYFPCRHGEGKLVAKDNRVMGKVLALGHVPLQYSQGEEGLPTEEYPANPNGSPMGIAALCDSTGRIFGMMPHPEACLDFTNHPYWTKLKIQAKRVGHEVPTIGQGFMLFKNVVEDARLRFSEMAVVL